LELTDCFSALFDLFISPIPHISSPRGVIFHVPDGKSVTEYFSELRAEDVSALRADRFANLDVIFFTGKPLILGDIPGTLDPFSLYVVVNRRSKEDPHLCFCDSQGWLSIRGPDIEKATSFRGDNVALLGYIRDPKCTHCFRNPLTGNCLKRNPINLSSSPSLGPFDSRLVLQGTRDELSLSESFPEMYFRLHELHTQASRARRFRSAPSGPLSSSNPHTRTSRTSSLPRPAANWQKQLRGRASPPCVRQSDSLEKIAKARPIAPHFSEPLFFFSR
jgi:hypothetical protein